MVPSKVAICIPYYGGIDPEHNQCVLGVSRLWPELPIIPLYSCPYIDMARSILVKAALDRGAETILFIDHDILFDARDIEWIVNQLYSDERYDVLGAPYSMRKPGGAMIGSFEYDPERKPTIFYEGGCIKRANYTGMGFTAIRRRVFEKLHETLPELNTGFVEGIRPYFSLMIVPEHKAYHGEDVSFCYRARDAGFGVWLDTRIRIQHKGAYRYMMEDTGIVVPTVNSLSITPTTRDDPSKPKTANGFIVDGPPACPPMVNS